MPIAPAVRASSVVNLCCTSGPEGGDLLMLARHLHSLLLIVLAELRCAGLGVFDFLLPGKPSLQRTKALSEMECERLLVLKPSPIGHHGRLF